MRVWARVRVWVRVSSVNLRAAAWAKVTGAEVGVAGMQVGVAGMRVGAVGMRVRIAGLQVWVVGVRVGEGSWLCYRYENDENNRS